MEATTTTTTTDADLAAFMIVNGLVFLRAEHSSPRSTFVLSDPRGQADSLRRQFIVDVNLRRVLAVRRGLINAVVIARTTPTAVCTATDLAQAGAIAAAHAAERRDRAATG
jgi:hypothetical protein